MDCYRLSAVVLSLLLSVCHSALAEQGEASALIQHRSQHAYISVFGLPAVAARLVPTREWQVSLEHSNQFMGGTAGAETLLLDGETTELMVRYRKRIGPCTQVESSIAFLSHTQGLFDEAIDDWHQFFGLPDAARDTSPFFALSYNYRDEEGLWSSVDRPQSGVGDVQVAVQRSLGCYAASDAAASKPLARAGIKLPTGSVAELRGSGEVDLFADYQSPVYAHGNRWRSGFAIGGLYVGESPNLSRQRSAVAYGTFGLQLTVHRRWRLLAQLDWHTAFYSSNLPELGDPAVSISGGVRYLGPANQVIELTISEDAAIDTTPDIVARLSWTYRPPGDR